MSRHSQVNGLEALEEEKGVEGGQARPHVSQKLHPHLQNEGRAGHDRLFVKPEGLPVAQAVVGRVGFRDLGEFPVRPVELSPVHDRAPDRGPVAADELGERVDHDVRSVFEGPEEIGRDRVVDHERYSVGVGHFGQSLEIVDVVLRVADRFHVKQPRIVVDRGVDELRRRGVGESGLDPEFRKGVTEKIVGSAVKVTCGYNVLARLRDIKRGQGYGRLSGGYGQGAHPAVECGQPLFQDLGRGVHDPGVNVPELLQGEEVRRVQPPRLLVEPARRAEPGD